MRNSWYQNRAVARSLEGSTSPERMDTSYASSVLLVLVGVILFLHRRRMIPASSTQYCTMHIISYLTYAVGGGTVTKLRIFASLV